MVFLLLFICAVAGLFKALSRGGPAFSRRDSYGLAILFTAIFLAATPGIGGGIYWVSALIVFGTGLLLFICWITLLLAWYKGKRSGWVLTGLCLCFIGMAGSNEIITIVSLVVVLTVSVYRVAKGRGIDLLSGIFLVLLVVCAGFFACFKGVGNRYTLMQTPDSGDFWYSAGFSVLVSGFCILKALMSPFCLAAILVGATAAALGTVLLKLGPRQDPFAANAVGSAVSVPITAAASFAMGESHALPTALASLWPLLYLTIAGSLGAYVIMSWLVNRWSVTRTAYVTVVVPVIALGLGSLVRHETLTRLSFAGTALVFVGLFLGMRPPARQA